jgi:hypothetical protein
MTIKKLNTPESSFPVYEALMNLLKVAGYETKDLTLSQMSAIKLNVIEAIETTDLNPSEYIKSLGLDSQVTFTKVVGE